MNSPAEEADEAFELVVAELAETINRTTPAIPADPADRVAWIHERIRQARDMFATTPHRIVDRPCDDDIADNGVEILRTECVERGRDPVEWQQFQLPRVVAPHVQSPERKNLYVASDETLQLRKLVGGIDLDSRHGPCCRD